jgi:pimeloyl-ACP methyl ester carboxylesterase
MKIFTPPKKRTAGYWLRLGAFFTVVLYLIVLISLPVYYGFLRVRPAHSQICCQTPADDGFQFEEISFQTHDGLTLRGWHIPGQNGAVIIGLHGYGGNRLGTWPQTRLLAKQGYGVLLYDQRATGQSDGENLSWGWRDVADVSDAVAFLQREKGYKTGKIGVYGCSTGAEIALASTALEPNISVVAAEDAEFSAAEDILIPPTWQDRLMFPIYPMFIKVLEWRTGTTAPISLTKAAARIAPRPLLLVSNGQEMDFLQAQYYFDLAKEPKEHWNLPDSFHCGGIATHPQEYEQKLVNFFSTIK